MSKEHLLNLLCRVYVQEISADEAFDELEDLIERTEREEYVIELENRLRALWDKYDGDRKHYMDRIKRLEEFARTIENDFDHDEDAHRYGTTCRVCDAEDLLKETKAKEVK